MQLKRCTYCTKFKSLMQLKLCVYWNGYQKLVFNAGLFFQLCSRTASDLIPVNIAGFFRQNPSILIYGSLPEVSSINDWLLRFISIYTKLELYEEILCSTHIAWATCSFYVIRWYSFYFISVYSWKKSVYMVSTKLPSPCEAHSLVLPWIGAKT